MWARVCVVLLGPLSTSPAHAEDRVTAHAGNLCSIGQLITPATHGHCCYPRQAWEGGACIGVPSRCPPGTEVEGESCARVMDVAAARKQAHSCGPGELATELSHGHCCFPGQTWNHQCVGVPTGCAPGFAVAGQTCVKLAVAEAPKEQLIPEHALRGPAPVGARKTTEEMLTGAPVQVLPERPTDASIVRVMASLKPRFRECYERFKVTANASVSLVIGGGGKPESAAVTGSLIGTPEGECVAAAVREARFPPFKSRVFAVNYPVPLP